MEQVLPVQNGRLAFYGLDPLRLEPLLQLAAGWRERYFARIVDTLPLVREAARAAMERLEHTRVDLVAARTIPHPA